MYDLNRTGVRSNHRGIPSENALLPISTNESGVSPWIPGHGKCIFTNIWVNSTLIWNILRVSPRFKNTLSRIMTLLNHHSPPNSILVSHDSSSRDRGRGCSIIGMIIKSRHKSQRPLHQIFKVLVYRCSTGLVGLRK